MWLGFTGTRHGMTVNQRITVEALLWRERDVLRRQELEVAHGDCVGADADFDEICRTNEIPDRVMLHPASDVAKDLRARCQTKKPRPPTATQSPEPALVRNRKIVDESYLLLAVPHGYQEEQRSGTWATVRYARRRGVPVAIVWPDGTVTREGAGPRVAVHSGPTAAR